MSHHKLLERQIRRHLGSAPGGDGVVSAQQLAAFIEAVDAAYRDADDDRESIERALELMSRELNQRNAQLSVELGERQQAEQALIREKSEQQALIKKLEEAHNQLLQSEKMASIGQLAAGVAHEINNPIGFVNSNLGTLRRYVSDLLRALDAHAGEAVQLPAATRQRLQALGADLELDYLREDIVTLLDESTDGIRRVRQIVQDLKDFSHVDEAQWTWSDLRQGLDSTLNIVNNEIKYVAEVVRDYDPIPEIECLPSQLNQVFLNMFVNASHAIAAMKNQRKGVITVRTRQIEPDRVLVEISDNGCGMEPQLLTRIFDPFFTTKPVGVGTGLGLSLAYGIVHKHGGRIEVHSEVGVGSRFSIHLPVQGQPDRHG
ncbi:ATP-binding protein [Aquabacterium sp.]|uniref:ATP-binding protein n=1 Tax=Aquabacterium sp. TaxID=1872578 RepID=UPI0035B0763B